MSAPTTRDLARYCKLSQSTVSLALREDLRIPEVTRKRVKEAAVLFGYRPNPLVSTLMSSVVRRKTGKSRGDVIAMANLLDQPEGWRFCPIYTSFYKGAKAQAEVAGYKLDEIWFQQPGMTEKRSEDIIKSRGIEAVLILPMRHFFADRLPLDISHLAAAAIGYTPLNPHLHRASPHHYQGARQAFDHVASLGWRRIGFFSNSYLEKIVLGNWLAAFLAFNHGRSAADIVPPLVVEYGDHSRTQPWVKKHRPEVIVTSEGSVYDDVCAMGLSVPEDVGIVHLDAAHQFQRNWAGIDQRPANVGAAAVDLIIGQLHRNERGVPPVPKTVLIEGIWKDGATLAIPARAR